MKRGSSVRLLLLSIILFSLITSLIFKIFHDKPTHTKNLKNLRKTVNLKKNLQQMSNEFRIKNLMKRLSFANQTRNIAYIHIGKTGGTTAGCMIRITQENGPIRRNVCNRVENGTLSKIKETETQVSKLVTKNYHVRKDKKLFKNFSTYLIIARHPIERFISWYFYQHPLNECENWAQKDVNVSSAYRTFSCYPDLNSFVTNGLQRVVRDLANNMSISLNDCQTMAYDCVIGKDKGCEHLYFNYEFYLGNEDILKNSSKDVFVLRTENFWNDWETINTMLLEEGDGNSTKKEITKIGHVTHKKNRFTGEKKHYQVTNRTISQKGIENICRVLCREIQYYKELLSRAANLDDADLDLSLAELFEDCPLEVSYHSHNECIV